jgi:hypothetical protein
MPIGAAFPHKAHSGLNFEPQVLPFDVSRCCHPTGKAATTTGAPANRLMQPMLRISVCD